MSEYYIGQTTYFKVNGILVPFVVEKDIEGWLFIKSLDLNFVAKVSTATWKKQRKLFDSERQ